MGIWSKSGIDDDSYDIDDWLEGDESWDTEWCMHCADDVKPDIDEAGNETCSICNNTLSIGDEWSTPDTARTEIATAPAISSGGDIWGRSSGFTWGKGTAWWNDGMDSGGSMSGMWGGTTTFRSNFSSFDADAYRMNKHRNHLDSLC